MTADYSFTPDSALESLLHELHARFRPRGGGLASFLQLLSTMGVPPQGLPPVFHVAGTNGKGSVLAFIQAILAASGHVVHKYTSPHLVRFEERVQLAGQPVAPDVLADALHRARDAAGDDNGFFAVTTAAAFDLFARIPAAAVLLETGVGGADDPTNAVSRVEAAVVTRISLDHQKILGESLADIAAHKGGIFKKDCPAIIMPQANTAVMAQLSQAARAADARLLDNWRVTPDGAAHFIYEDSCRRLRLPLPALRGAHQVLNAGAALAAVAASRFASALDDIDKVATAMANVVWPARLQQLQQGPLVDLLRNNDEIWIDGAHNDSGAEVLAAQAAAWRRQDAKPLVMLTAFKAQKDWREFYAALLPQIAALYAINAQTDALTARVLLPTPVLWTRLCADFPPPLHTALAEGRGGLSPAQAIRDAQARVAAKNGCRFLVCGSLYLAGYILRDHG